MEVASLVFPKTMDLYSESPLSDPPIMKNGHKLLNSGYSATSTTTVSLGSATPFMLVLFWAGALYFFIIWTVTCCILGAVDYVYFYIIIIYIIYIYIASLLMTVEIILYFIIVAIIDFNCSTVIVQLSILM